MTTDSNSSVRSDLDATRFAHAEACGALCVDADGDLCCDACGVSLDVCDVCGAPGYHRSGCVEIDGEELTAKEESLPVFTDARSRFAYKIDRLRTQICDLVARFDEAELNPEADLGRVAELRADAVAAVESATERFTEIENDLFYECVEPISVESEEQA
jgi:hypothetical protein